MTACDNRRVRQMFYASDQRAAARQDGASHLHTSHARMRARRSRKNRMRVADLPPLEAQPDLFNTARTADPLTGLAVKLPNSCGKCGHLVAIVGAGKPPHFASLRCQSCGMHRGWVSRANYTFPNEIINKFGAPTEPIVFRNRSTEPDENDDGSRVV
jgi:hypothetical protein